MEIRKHGANSRPLLTICNHQSCIDDPLVWGALLKWRDVFAGRMRWVPVAAELCFTNRFYSFIFGHGQCVPVVRGLGVYQRGVEFCIDRLNEGEWVHFFPEGKVNLDDSRRLKWGIGRVVADCAITPDVQPIWIIGMNDILPNKTPYIPRIRKTITVYVGAPIRLEAMVTKLKEQTSDARELRKQITDHIQKEFWALGDKAMSHHQRSCER